MKYYIYVFDNEINGKGMCPIVNKDWISIEVSENIYNEDYKYIYSDGELIFDENWEEKVLQKEKEQKIQEINQKIAELEQESVKEILYGNDENIKVYQDVINGLVETRNNL